MNEVLDLDPGLVKVRVGLDLAQNLDKLIESCFDEFWSVSLLARQSFDINAIVGKYAEIVLLTLAQSDIAIILVYFQFHAELLLGPVYQIVQS